MEVNDEVYEINKQINIGQTIAKRHALRVAEVLPQHKDIVDHFVNGLSRIQANCISQLAGDGPQPSLHNIMVWLGGVKFYALYWRNIAQNMPP